MASVSRKYKEAQERWIQHCHDIERSTAKIPKGTEQERKDRIARARKDYRYFVRTYFPHLATTECADFQVDAAVYMRDHENARGLFEWARGHAKSTHISLLQPLWLKIQPNAQPLIMILVSKSQEAARRLLGDLQAELESNDLYNADFGNQRGAGIWTNGEFTTATGDLFIALGLGFLIGIVIAIVYRKTYRGVLYSPSFTLTLIMLTLITTPVVMCIKNDIALSMGMVGALSIVRFRTAVKDPLDTAYMFWALTMGILLGAGLYLIAVIVVLCIAILMFVISLAKLTTPNAYLLVVHYDEFCEAAIQSELNRSVRSSKLRSKTLTRAGAEMTYEVRISERTEVVTRMLDIEGVHDATLVACQSEVGA